MYGDHEGNILRVWIGYSIAQSPFEAEAYATAQTLKLAEEVKNPKLVIEGDPEDVILALRGHSHAEDWTGIHFINKVESITKKGLLENLSYS